MIWEEQPQHDNKSPVETRDPARFCRLISPVILTELV